MYRPEKIIVVGGNAAGPSAAAKAKRINSDSDIKLFEASDFISTGTCELPYLLSGDIKSYKEIVFFSPEKFYEEKGVEVFVNHSVLGIDTKLKEISVKNNKDQSISHFEYDKLILTTGSKPNEIRNLSYYLENVFSYKSVGDYLKINNYLEANEVARILIVGSGYIGLELADVLKSSGFDVTLFEKEELPMPSADKEIQLLIRELIDSKEINFKSNDESSQFIISDNKLTHFKYEGRFLEFDMAIVAAGVSPNIDLASGAGLKVGNLGGLRVDSRMKTSDPDIYAAGDNVELKNRITNDNDYFPLATYAHSTGHIAGENAAGGNSIAEPIVLNSTFKFAEKYIAQVGLTHAKAQDYFPNSRFVTAVAYNRVKVMPNSGKVFGKILFDKNTRILLGAGFVGKEEVSGYADLIASMILNKTKADSLAKINFNYTPPLSPFINLLSILGRKISEIN